MDMLNELEAAVLDMLLVGDLPVLACLRAQRRRIHVVKRDYHEFGVYTWFGHPDDAVPLSSPTILRFGDVLADIDGLSRGANFKLGVNDGLLSLLDSACNYSEPWVVAPVRFELRYRKPDRDLSILQSRRHS